MNIEKISIGKNAPHEVNVIIEVPMNADPVKYEMDKESGAIFVDRFIATPMYYPCNYGFIPNTLSDDGDPCDVLVVSDFAVVPGAVIAVKPVGVLIMEDEKGMDEKIIAVPAKKLNSQFENIESYQQLPENLIQKIKHFFEHYKDLEKNKWVKVTGFEDAAKARSLIQEAIDRAKNK
ncbi:MAG: inorganic diphosphatase [Rickettsiales bacterium]|nr:inorganic diphosphatase [Rickettsiales bacterium]